MAECRGIKPLWRSFLGRMEVPQKPLSLLPEKEEDGGWLGSWIIRYVFTMRGGHHMVVPRSRELAAAPSARRA